MSRKTNRSRKHSRIIKNKKVTVGPDDPQIPRKQPKPPKVATHKALVKDKKQNFTLHEVSDTTVLIPNSKTNTDTIEVNELVHQILTKSNYRQISNDKELVQNLYMTNNKAIEEMVAELEASLKYSTENISGDINISKQIPNHITNMTLGDHYKLAVNLKQIGQGITTKTTINMTPIDRYIDKINKIAKTAIPNELVKVRLLLDDFQNKIDNPLDRINYDLSNVFGTSLDENKINTLEKKFNKEIKKLEALSKLSHESNDLTSPIEESSPILDSGLTIEDATEFNENAANRALTSYYTSFSKTKDNISKNYKQLQTIGQLLHNLNQENPNKKLQTMQHKINQLVGLLETPSPFMTTYHDPAQIKTDNASELTKEDITILPGDPSNLIQHMKEHAMLSNFITDYVESQNLEAQAGSDNQKKQVKEWLGAIANYDKIKPFLGPKTDDDGIEIGPSVGIEHYYQFYKNTLDTSSRAHRKISINESGQQVLTHIRGKTGLLNIKPRSQQKDIQPLLSIKKSLSEEERNKVELFEKIVKSEGYNPDNLVRDYLSEVADIVNTDGSPIINPYLIPGINEGMADLLTELKLIRDRTNRYSRPNIKTIPDPAEFNWESVGIDLEIAKAKYFDPMTKISKHSSTQEILQFLIDIDVAKDQQTESGMVTSVKIKDKTLSHTDPAIRRKLSEHLNINKMDKTQFMKLYSEQEWSDGDLYLLSIWLGLDLRRGKKLELENQINAYFDEATKRDYMVLADISQHKLNEDTKKDIDAQVKGVEQVLKSIKPIATTPTPEGGTASSRKSAKLNKQREIERHSKQLMRTLKQIKTLIDNNTPDREEEATEYGFGPIGNALITDLLSGDTDKFKRDAPNHLIDDSLIITDTLESSEDLTDEEKTILAKKNQKLVKEFMEFRNTTSPKLKDTGLEIEEAYNLYLWTEFFISGFSKQKKELLKPDTTKFKPLLYNFELNLQTSNAIDAIVTNTGDLKAARTVLKNQNTTQLLSERVTRDQHIKNMLFIDAIADKPLKPTDKDRLEKINEDYKVEIPLTEGTPLPNRNTLSTLLTINRVGSGENIAKKDFTKALKTTILTLITSKFKLQDKLKSDETFADSKSLHTDIKDKEAKLTDYIDPFITEGDDLKDLFSTPFEEDVDAVQLPTEDFESLLESLDTQIEEEEEPEYEPITPTKPKISPVTKTYNWVSNTSIKKDGQIKRVSLNLSKAYQTLGKKTQGVEKTGTEAIILDTLGETFKQINTIRKEVTPGASEHAIKSKNKRVISLLQSQRDKLRNRQDAQDLINIEKKDVDKLISQLDDEIKELKKVNN